MPVTCDINTVIIIGCVVLIIAFANELFTSIPALLKLFTNPVNFVLLIILVILVILIDLPIGIILSFLILYLAVYVKNLINNKKDKLNNIVITSKLLNNSINSINNNNNNNNTHRNASDIPDFQQPPIRIGDGDINTQDIRINSQATHQQQQTQPQTTGSNAIQSSTIQQPQDMNGYDVVGCRYDFKDSQQNMTLYGLPLASCGAYNKEQRAKCGAVFYPLNA